jgi:hypothetical protein
LLALALAVVFPNIMFCIRSLAGLERRIFLIGFDTSDPSCRAGGRAISERYVGIFTLCPIMLANRTHEQRAVAHAPSTMRIGREKK